MVAGGLVYNFDGYALLDPDEGRNAEVAREMAVSNDYVLPRLNGLPYADKPVLYFAAGALVMEVLGPTPLAARLPSLAFTIATLLVVGLFTRRLFGREAAATAAIVTAATPFTLAYSRTVIFDSALTLWVLLALVGFFLSLEGTGTQGEPHEAEDTRAAAWYRALAWLALGLGVLTKGPIAFGLPLMVALPYALWCRRARALADPVSILLFLAILLPWVFAMSREVPGFLEYVVLTETASRLTTPALERTGPFWYFLAILPAAVLPWSLVLAFGWLVRRRSRAVHPGSRPDRRLIFLILWLVVPLVFFSLSQSKRPQYVLPMVPAVGILVGALWKNARGRLPGVRVASIGMALLGVCLLLARHRIADWVPATTDVGEQIPITATVLGGVCLVTGAGAWAWASHRGAVLLALSLPVAAVPFASAGLMAAIGRQRSAEELASAIQTAAGPVAEVVGVAAFPPSLPFYLNRTLLLSTTDGVELTSNYLVGSLDLWRTAPDTPLRDDRWWREAMMHCSRARVFVVRVDDTQTRAFLDGALPLIMVTHKYVAYGPCGTGRLARSRQLRNPIPPRQYEAPTPMDHTRRGAGS